MFIMDGFMVIWEIWEMDDDKVLILIVVLIVNVFEDDRKVCFVVGMNDYFVKLVCCVVLF